MSYTLQALIGSAASLNLRDADETINCIYMAQGQTMIPLASDIRKRYAISFLPLTDEGVGVLPEQIRALCAELFPSGAAAYLEAEIFGGEGMQACALFKDAEARGAVIVSEDAINHALKAIGIEKGKYLDEFEALDLGRHRDTDRWEVL